MPATIELTYFNSFWLKKMKTLVDVNPSQSNRSTAGATTGTTITLTSPGLGPDLMNVGMQVTGTGITSTAWIVSRTSDTVFELNKAYTIGSGDVLVFGEIINFDNIPRAYGVTSSEDWYEEEARVRGGYNNTITDLGVKAYITEENPKQSDRFNSMIYSGIFNPRTGVNSTNQFPVGEDISKSLNPSYDSIQKLYAEDTNLIIFQEQKVSRALIDKDAIYSAEGSPVTTSGTMVIGQVVGYAGEYGISQDPFSFAVYGYRKYFTDRNRNCVLRLSRDGITEISSYGMRDFFRDSLSNSSVNKIVGAWDAYSQSYVLSIQTSNSYNTLAFDEGVLGWTSFFDYKPAFVESLGAKFYSFNSIINISLEGFYQHHQLNPTYPNVYANFYNITYDSTVKLVLNANPSVVKNFKTINYEGGTEWAVSSISASNVSSGVTPTDLAADVLAIGLPISKYIQPTSLSGLQNQIFENNFKRKENKYFAKIVNNTSFMAGEIFSGQQTSGLQGFFATIDLTLKNRTINPLNNLLEGIGKKELFSVSSEIIESSY